MMAVKWSLQTQCVETQGCDLNLGSRSGVAVVASRGNHSSGYVSKAECLVLSRVQNSKDGIESS